jgi:hypothetical protein
MAITVNPQDIIEGITILMISPKETTVFVYEGVDDETGEHMCLYVKNWIDYSEWFPIEELKFCYFLI